MFLRPVQKVQGYKEILLILKEECADGLFATNAWIRHPLCSNCYWVVGLGPSCLQNHFFSYAAARQLCSFASPNLHVGEINNCLYGYLLHVTQPEEVRKAPILLTFHK